MFVYSADVLGIIVTGVGQDIVDELEDTGGGAVGRACLLVPGQIAWDGCDCGQLAQTITSVVPSNGNLAPATDTRQTPCGPNQVIVNVVASVVRCIHVGNDHTAAAPSCAALRVDALTLERDRFAVRKAVQCSLKTLRDAYLIADFSVGTAVSVGPEGACGGVELTYSFSIANGAGCC